MKIKLFNLKYRGRLLIMIGVIPLVSLLFLFRPPSASEPKATWLWNTELIEDHAEDIISFAKSQGAKVIFLHISQKIDNEAYRQFISLASSSKIEVHALNGKPEWALREFRHEGDAFLLWVKTYNEAVDPKERFTGVQYDVEPYLLKNWKKDQASIVEQWMESVRVWIEYSQSVDLPIGAAVPFWLHEISHPAMGVDIPLSEWMVDKFDYLAIMAYRNDAERVYDISRLILAESDRKKKNVWVGIELGKSNEGPGVSFHDKSVISFVNETNKLEKLAGRHTSFSGIAIHSYDTWYNKLMLTKTALNKENK
ncbi:hypothetical protein SAMN04488542_105193 [Fontibacillus panacisegetis]|uniref:Glycosyl hydrolase catalytic core n=2 Tax=Fontibacillus panacisegetis TaxID=670482 RepID=A0A1G7I9H6_9BACL|nr:hypothetical protein SAMN04488542_105193 [Fontibacillus panacisegetis]